MQTNKSERGRILFHSTICILFTYLMYSIKYFYNDMENVPLCCLWHNDEITEIDASLLNAVE